jgi:hypothetical protein
MENCGWAQAEHLSSKHFPLELLLEVFSLTVVEGVPVSTPDYSLT